MIIFVSELRPNLLDEVSEKLFMVVTKVQQPNLKKLVIGSAADFSHATRFAFDLTALKDTDDEVIEAVSAFQTMYPGIRIIVIGAEELRDRPLFTRLMSMGVYDIVTDINNDTLTKCLAAGMSKEDADESRAEKIAVADDASPEQIIETQDTDTLPTREKITANRSFKKHKQFISVAVCGTEPHIGATHHALLMAKFLCGVGFKTCYLEANERRNILYIARAYAVNANERKHMLQFDGVDMYFDFKLPEVVAANYDFLIFDFGRFGEFEPASFLTKDIKLIVGGVKPWEMAAYTRVFDAIDGYRDVQFIMNHAPSDEESGIRALMGGYKTHFSEYAPYQFAADVNTEVYKDIFGDYLNVERSAPKPEQNNQKGFWSKWR